MTDKKALNWQAVEYIAGWHNLGRDALASSVGITAYLFLFPDTTADNLAGWNRALEPVFQGDFLLNTTSAGGDL